jgi:hypothetical protein
MNYVVWRLHRTHVTVACPALAALAALLVVTGINMASTFDAAVTSCRATHSCDQLPTLLFQNDSALVKIVAGTMVLPALLGVLWGAPLVAGELESRTTDLIWTQSVTRRRWMLTNIGWALLAAGLWGGLLTILVSWWRVPENALFDRLSPGAFDVQGIVPIAYSVFAMALGIAAGVLLRRVIPALATALAGFIVVRALVALFIRQHFIAPVTHNFPIYVSNARSLAHSWWLTGYIADSAGQSSQTGIRVPAACQLNVYKQFEACLATHGYHRIVTYQPANRFWTFQAIEFGIFLVPTIALLAVAYVRVTAADA